MTTMLEERESKDLARRWPMFPTYGRPFIHRFMDDMERVFEDLSVGTGPRMPRFEERWNEVAWTPKVEAFEKNGQFVVRAELPGLKKEEVKIEATEEGLTLEGERKLEKEEKREGYYFTERSYGSFYRRIPLPEGANFEKANAVFKDGVLEVTIPVPKREERKARRLEIKTM